MRLLSFYNSRKYFFRILISTILLVTICLGTFSAILYYYTKHTTLTLQQDSTKNVLNQVSYNVENLNELVKNFTLSLYFQNDMTILTKSKSDDIFELPYILINLNNYVLSNTFVHSVIIHNATNKCYYSTLNPALVDCANNPQDNPLSKLLQTGQSLPKLQLIPGETSDYFSYFMFDSPSYQPNQSIMMVNVKSQWLFDNIQTINNLGDHSQSMIMLMDANGQFMATDNHASIPQKVREAIQRHITLSQLPNDYFILSGPDKEIVTYITSKTNDWKVISIQSYQAVFGKVEHLRSVSLVILFVFIVIAVTGSIFLSLKLYKPVGTLVSTIHGLSKGKKGITRGEDELSYMSNIYHDIFNSLNRLELKQSQNDDIVRNYNVRLLLTRSQNLSAEEFQELLRTHRLLVEPTGPYVVCLLKIDKFNNFRLNFKESDQQLIKYAISNIASELFLRKFTNQPVEMREDHIAFILSVSSVNENHLFTELASICQEIHKVILEYYYVSLTASLSDVLPDYSRISSGYDQSLQNSLYRFALGSGSVITPSQINIAEDNDYSLPANLEQKIGDSLKMNDVSALEENLEAAFAHISRLDYDWMVHSTLHLVMIFNRTIRELNLNKVEMSAINLKEFNSSVLEKDTLEEVHRLFVSFAHRFAEQRQMYPEHKNDFLIEAINETIQKKYADPGLSLNSIAAFFKMSPTYMGRMYRNSEKRSVADYINETRLAHAIHMLENSDENISVIMQKVGYRNESNFFKLFRKNTGTTPREYRSRKIEINGEEFLE